MDVMFTHCAGLDVHKKTVMACRVTPDPTGQQPDGLLELKAFGTMTTDLRALSDWLAAAGITHVAMESTGEYWKPFYHTLEGDFTVFLVNAAHVKQVPGRKTDKADARCLAKLMRYGLLQASFILPAEQRDSRDLTRYRTNLVQERSRKVNWVQGVLERANIKLAEVATDIMGVSARAILAALVEGWADPATMAEWAKRRMRSKMPLLEQALTGLVRDHHRQLLALPLAHIDFLDEPIDALDGEITCHLAALSGDAPDNEESAGKQRSGKTRQGNQALHTGLTQLAHAAARTKGAYLSALYQRLAARRGKKRAIVAVAHSIVVSAFHMLSRHEPYRELGSNYFDDHRRAHLVDQLMRRIERLGYHVPLEPVVAA